MLRIQIPTDNDPQDLINRFTSLYQAAFQGGQSEHKGILFFKGMMYLVAFNAGIPYVKPATQLSSNETLSYFLGASVYIAIGSVCVRSILNFMSYLGLMSQTTDQRSERVITISSVGLGMVSALPGALVTLKYNPLWVLPLSLFFDISTNASSYNELFRQFYYDRFLYRHKQPLIRARDRLIAQLHDGVGQELATLNPDEQAVMNELKLVVSRANLNEEVRRRHPWVFGHGLYLSEHILGLLFPLSWEIVCIYFVYEEMQKYLSMHAVFAGLIAVVTTFPAFYLEYLFSKLIIASTYRLIANKWYGVQTTYPAFAAYPKATILLVMISGGLVSGAFASRAEIILDTLDSNLFRLVLLCSVCIGAMLFKISAAVSNVLDIENRLLARFSSQQGFSYQILFNTFGIVLKTAPPERVNTLLTQLDLVEAFETHPPENTVLLSSPDTQSYTDMNWGVFFRAKKQQQLPRTIALVVEEDDDERQRSPSYGQPMNAIESSISVEPNSGRRYA